MARPGLFGGNQAAWGAKAMDQFLELADQRPYPSASEGAGPAPVTLAPASPLAGDLPALLLAVLPLIQAIDWLESASASTLDSLAEISAPLGEPLSAPGPSLANQLAIESALAAIDSADYYGGGGTLVYSADIVPLSLTIDSGDLFSDAGALAEVTPRFASASFVENVENDIFGRELNVAETPLAAPTRTGNPTGTVSESISDVPFEGEDPTSTETDTASTGGNGWVSSTPWNPDKGTGTPPPESESQTFTMVDLTEPPITRAEILV